MTSLGQIYSPLVAMMYWKEVSSLFSSNKTVSDVAVYPDRGNLKRYINQGEYETHLNQKVQIAHGPSVARPTNIVCEKYRGIYQVIT